MIPKALTKDDGLIHLISHSTNRDLITFCGKKISLTHKCRAKTCTCGDCYYSLEAIKQETINAVMKLYEY